MNKLLTIFKGRMRSIIKEVKFVVKKGLELEYLLEGLKDLVTQFRKQESKNMEKLMAIFGNKGGDESKEGV